jgi:hypothetical protein
MNIQQQSEHNLVDAQAARMQQHYNSLATLLNQPNLQSFCVFVPLLPLSCSLD